jgi:hypothetical protein
MKVGFSLLVLAVILIGITFGMLRAQGTSGPANPAGRMLTSETRTIGKGIDSVELAGPIDLTLRYGPVASLEVRGEQRLLGNVETSQDGGTLRIRTRGIVLRHNRPLEAVVVLPALTNLDVAGNGDSNVDGFSGERIEVNLNGSGSVKFNGRFQKVAAGLHGTGDLEVTGGNSDSVEADVMGSGHMTLLGSSKLLKATSTGSGELDARHLRADTVVIEQMGSGSSIVAARQSVAATIRGSGDIEVYGNPNQRSVNRTGSGEVTFSD